ncbi:MAG: cupin domain-containing protein [Actinobacteria bacterium]|nr:cupin domain-containing protein [Alphaproteobacteria bacterium]MBM4437889.1 cupin domain-containing protein [Actinomycetota bacterium]
MDNATTAEVVLPGEPFDPTLAFFTDKLGFRVEQISPADGPVTTAISGHGLRLRLDKAHRGAAGVVRIAVPAPELQPALTAPNGTRVEFVDADPPIVIPDLVPERVVTRFAKDAAWIPGRAGLQYRDLIPTRLGGRFIASHIRLTEGGPVPDYTHFHKVRCQLIYCVQGWIRVAYEDQGEPFVMQAGDCVLQPPRIRHRVMETAAGAAVVEVACPAEHSTHADWSMTLPRPPGDRRRRYGGQRFVRHVAANAQWTPWREGFEARDLGIAAATDGLASARAVRAHSATILPASRHAGEFLFLFIETGRAMLKCGGSEALQAGDACSIPAGVDYGFADCSPDFAFLEVTLPGSPG